MVKQIVMQVVGGSFKTGFAVSVQISDLGKLIHSNYAGRFPVNDELIPAYEQWKKSYYLSPTIRSAGIRDPRIIFSEEPVQIISQSEYVQDFNTLQTVMNQWLRSREIQDILDHIVDEVGRLEPARLIISSDCIELQLLPWQIWSLLTRRPRMEVSFMLANFGSLSGSLSRQNH